MRIWHLVLVVASGAIAWALVSAIIHAREAAREASCQGRLNQLQLALRNYETVNGSFPPAFIQGPDGNPWHSWRVLILPHLGFNEVFNRYRFDEPWNGPNNRLLADQIPIEVFQCPSGRDIGRTQNTNYVVVVGEGTAFPGDESTKLKDFHDKPENTILIVEIARGEIHWMEPRDLRLDSITWEDATQIEPVLSDIHAIGTGVVLADHIRCYRAPKSLPLETLRGLATNAGGESTTRDSLTRGEHSKILSAR